MTTDLVKSILISIPDVPPVWNQHPISLREQLDYKHCVERHGVAILTNLDAEEYQIDEYKIEVSNGLVTAKISIMDKVI
jgi:hypothetical protein